MYSRNVQFSHLKDRGFALVLALCLLGFVSLLALSLSALVRLEFRRLEQERVRARAQECAKLGIYEALNSLQHALGSDCRATSLSKEDGDIVCVWDAQKNGKHVCNLRAQEAIEVSLNENWALHSSYGYQIKAYEKRKEEAVAFTPLGVLSNSRAGGLKQDLLAHLQNIDFAQSPQPIFEYTHLSSTLYGPLWNVLVDYANLSATQSVPNKSIVPQPGVLPAIKVHRTRSSVSQDFYCPKPIWKEGQIATSREDGLFNAIGPIVLEGKLQYNLSATIDCRGRCELFIHCTPRLKLLNPYNVALTPAQYRFNWRNFSLPVDVVKISPTGESVSLGFEQSRHGGDLARMFGFKAKGVELTIDLPMLASMAIQELGLAASAKGKNFNIEPTNNFASATIKLRGVPLGKEAAKDVLQISKIKPSGLHPLLELVLKNQSGEAALWRGDNLVINQLREEVAIAELLNGKTAFLEVSFSKVGDPTSAQPSNIRSYELSLIEGLNLGGHIAYPDNYRNSFLKIPQVPLQTIADFADADLSRYAYEPLKAIGNSRNPSVFSSSGHVFEKFVDGPSLQTAVDLSYLLNQSLYDNYFMPSQYSVKSPDALQPQESRYYIQNPFNVNCTCPQKWMEFLIRADVRGQLSGSQKQALGYEIAKQVDMRGTFLSLSEFVNRDPEKSRFAACGPLQAAIDIVFKNDGSFFSQSDLLKIIEPFLTTRTDTFSIIATGQVYDPDTQELKAHVACEAIVQRLDEYVDPADSAYLCLESLVSPLNKEFGRKFKIVGFSWL